MSSVGHPTLVLLEHLTPQGWVRGTIASLLYPEAYPKRLRARGKFGRATVLDDRLQPTGRVWVSDDVPADPSVLVKTNDGTTHPWKLPDPNLGVCPHCDSEHLGPYDGRCLL